MSTGMSLRETKRLLQLAIPTYRPRHDHLPCELACACMDYNGYLYGMMVNLRLSPLEGNLYILVDVS